jgi:(2Fe-2S) ferredoxin
MGEMGKRGTVNSSDRRCMARFQHLFFVCQKNRAPGHSKGSCCDKGSEELLSRLKALTQKHGLKGKVRVTASGCLDFCAQGCSLVAFSPGHERVETWYTGVRPDDAEALFEAHILNDSPLSRLVHEIKRPVACQD